MNEINAAAVKNLMANLGVKPEEILEANEVLALVEKYVKDGKIRLYDLLINQDENILKNGELKSFVSLCFHDGILEAKDFFKNGEKSDDTATVQSGSPVMQPIAEDERVYGSAGSIYSSKVDKIEYRTDNNSGLEYAIHKGKVLGVVLSGNGTGSFIFALKNFGQNVKIGEARKIAAKQGTIDGKEWIVPSDNHFLAVKAQGLEKVNSLLAHLGGDKLGPRGLLSTTSQHNMPLNWDVRFVMEI